MKTINWSWCEVDDEIAVLILSEVNEKYAMHMNETPFIIPRVKTVEEAYIFATQTQKPIYYNEFGAGYEVVYLDNESQEWADLFAKWENTNELFYNAIVPWYQRLFLKVKGWFK